MGTTLTALLLRDDVVAVVHVGDSRAYRWHAGALEQVTRDHSVVQLLVELGELTPEQAENHPQRHVIVKALRGEGDAVAADVQLVPAVPGDRWLVCSDGVSERAGGRARRRTGAGALPGSGGGRASSTPRSPPAARTTSHASSPTSAPACAPANGPHCSRRCRRARRRRTPADRRHPAAAPAGLTDWAGARRTALDVRRAR